MNVKSMLIRLPTFPQSAMDKHTWNYRDNSTWRSTRNSFGGGMSPLLVLAKDPPQMHNCVYEIATYFRREFGYDFVQYSKDKRDPEDKCQAFLWYERNDFSAYESDVVYGACCFRYREWKNSEPGWSLQWVWFHPFQREKGHLKNAIPLFKKLYGNFEVEAPYSRAMKQCVDKYQLNRKL